MQMISVKNIYMTFAYPTSNPAGLGEVGLINPSVMQASRCFTSEYAIT